MRYDTKGNTRRYTFESLADLSKYIADTPRKWSCNLSAESKSYDAWDLGASLDDALRMSRLGWIEGAQRTRETLKIFSPLEPAPRVKMDFIGHMPHVPAYCAGSPVHMLRKAKQATIGGGRILTLYVSVNANAATGAQEMSNYGLAVARYIHQLEAKGMRVELWGIAVSIMSTTGRLTNAWRIKSADQPLDLAVLAFSVGHPAMLRRLEFALCERCSFPTQPGYGSATGALYSDLSNAPRGAVLLNGMENAHRHSRTPESALAHVTQAIDAALAARKIAKGEK